MKKYNLFALSVILFTLLFSACEEKKKETTLSNSQLLTTKKWKLTSAIITPSIQGISDYYATLKSCEVDDILTFTSDNKYIRDEGKSKCDSTSAQTYTGTWQLLDNDTRLLISEDGDASILNIEVINNNTLKLNTIISEYTLSFTYTAQ